MDYSGSVKRKMQRIIISLVGLGLVLLGIDFLYSLVVRSRLAAWEDGLVRGPDGVVAGCEPFEMGEGKTALLLVHGFSDSPALFNKMAPALAEQGFYCRAIRLPGWAEPMDRLGGVKREDWLKAVELGVTDLRDASYDHVVVLAHSLGAACALELAARARIRADALVILAPMLKVSDRRSPVLSSRTWHEVGKWILPFTRSLESSFPVDQHDPEGRDDNHRDRFIPRSVYDELFALIDSLAGRAGEIHLPVLMVLSEEDQVIDYAYAEDYFNQLDTDDKKLVTLKNSGHVIPLDYEWEMVVGLTVDFVKEHAGE
jgi:carboxylesterase